MLLATSPSRCGYIKFRFFEYWWVTFWEYCMLGIITISILPVSGSGWRLMSGVFCPFYRDLLRKSKWRRKDGMGNSSPDFVSHSEIIFHITCISMRSLSFYCKWFAWALGMSQLVCRYIKDYDGGTLMECRIDPKLPYIDLPAMIRLQRQACVSSLNLFIDDSALRYFNDLVSHICGTHNGSLLCLLCTSRIVHILWLRETSWLGISIFTL